MKPNTIKSNAVRGNLGPGAKRMPPIAKASKSTIKTLSRLIKYIFKEYKLHLLFVLISIVISSLVTVASNLFLKTLVDDFITPMLDLKTDIFPLLLRTLGVMAIIYICGVTANYIYNRLMVNVCQGTLKNVRDDMFAHMEKLPISYFDTHPHGEIMSLYTNDTDTLRQMISQSMPQLFSSIVTVVSVFISMLMLNLSLTAVTVAMVIIMTIVAKKIGGKSASYFIKQQKDIGDMNGYIEEMMEGQRVVKVFCHEHESKLDFDKLNTALFESSNSANTYANVLMPIMNNIGHISYVVVTIVGAALAIGGVGSLTLGGLISFLQLSKNFNMPITQISQQMNFVIMALAGAERIFNFLDTKVEQDNGEVSLVNAEIDKENNIVEVERHTGIWAWKHCYSTGSVKYERVAGEITFDNVSFGYSDKKIILKDINLYAKPGQRVAFVGATGAGKTTITNLINRFYDIQKGKITYDGLNIGDISKQYLRQSLGIVLQDTHLFTGTVAENIKYGKLHATEAEVFEAARLANADIFIKHLPKGYNTMLTGDGANLSQGQRQLLAIARAAIADPPVLILDEATSSIDTRTEAIVQSGMEKLMQGRTVFVIAHRLSTITSADVIMVLEDGRIIERGNHNELLDKKGKYYSLYTGAFQLE